MPALGTDGEVSGNRYPGLPLSPCLGIFFIQDIFDEPALYVGSSEVCRRYPAFLGSMLVSAQPLCGFITI